MANERTTQVSCRANCSYAVSPVDIFVASLALELVEPPAPHSIHVMHVSLFKDGKMSFPFFNYLNVFEAMWKSVLNHPSRSKLILDLHLLVKLESKLLLVQLSCAHHVSVQILAGIVVSIHLSKFTTSCCTWCLLAYLEINMKLHFHFIWNLLQLLSIYIFGLSLGSQWRWTLVLKIFRKLLWVQKYATNSVFQDY